MIPNSTLDVSVIDSNFTGESIGMTVDEESLDHIMSVLTDLYSDQIMACIREYSTNARDAHVENGNQDEPIEVTTPSTFHPMFKVKDFGPGLSLDDIRNVYSKYGSSTKRGSNAVNGMLGLGAKAALTYTSSFTVTSVNDGMKHIISVGRNESGGGMMEVVSSHETTERSGVEITIPVPAADHTAFKSKVDTFFQYWPEGSVIINGTPNSGFDFSEWTQMDDDGKIWFTGGSTGYNQGKVVMGGVAYPNPFESPFDSYGSDFIYFADMGEVVFSPSRESLLTNGTNRAVIDKVTETIIASAKGKVQEAVEASPGVVAAYATAKRLNRTVLGRIRSTATSDPWEYLYNGRPLSDRRDTVGGWGRAGGWVGVHVVPSYGSASSPTVYESHSWNSDPAYAKRMNTVVAEYIMGGGAVILVGLPDSDILSNGNRRSTLNRGLRHLDLTGKRVVAVDSLTISPQVKGILGDDVPVITYDEVKEASKAALKEMRNSNPKPKRARATGDEVDIIERVSHQGTLTTSVGNVNKSGDKVVLLARGDIRSSNSPVAGWSSQGRSIRFTSLMSNFSDYTFVAMTDDAQKKFISKHPKAVTLQDFLDNLNGETFISEVIKKTGGKVSRDDVIEWGCSVSRRSRVDIAISMVDNGYTDSDLLNEYHSRVTKSSADYQFIKTVIDDWSDWFYLSTFAAFAQDKMSKESINDLGDKIKARYPLIEAFDQHVPALYTSKYIPYLVEHIKQIDSSESN